MDPTTSVKVFLLLLALFPTGQKYQNRVELPSMDACPVAVTEAIAARPKNAAMVAITCQEMKIQTEGPASEPRRPQIEAQPQGEKF